MPLYKFFPDGHSYNEGCGSTQNNIDPHNNNTHIIIEGHGVRWVLPNPKMTIGVS